MKNSLAFEYVVPDDIDDEMLECRPFGLPNGPIAGLFRLPEYWAGTRLMPGDVLRATFTLGDTEWHWQILRSGRAEARGEALVG